MDQKNSHQNVALIVGVTGMAGIGLAEALKQPTALGNPWIVYGAARRAKPSWFPPAITDHYITFDATDFEDTCNKINPISDEVTHLFWVALQVRENEEERTQINATMLDNVLRVLKSSPGSKLCHVTLQTGTQHYMGPIHDPAQSSHLVPHDPPFSEDMPRLPYPNFYYALEDVLASHAPEISYSVHRTSIIVGASVRSVYNALLTLAVYASICRHEGLPFRYPGTRYTWDHFCDMSDTRVIAGQQIWAAVTPRAKNQAFNCTNGDFFKWKSMWKVMSGIFGVEYVEFDESVEFDFVRFMEDKAKVWDKIVEMNGLCKTKLEEITCPGALNYVLHFGFQHVSSMNKSREYGFFGHANTLKSIPMWVNRLRNMKMIPQLQLNQ